MTALVPPQGTAWEDHTQSNRLTVPELWTHTAGILSLDFSSVCSLSKLLHILSFCFLLGQDEGSHCGPVWSAEEEGEDGKQGLVLEGKT